MSDVLAAELARASSPVLLDCLQRASRDGEPRVRAVAVRALGRLERPGLVPDILPALEAGDAAVRAEAANAAVQAAGRDAAAGDAARSALLGRAGREPDGDVRAAISEALGRIPGGSAEARLATERFLAAETARAKSRKDHRIEPAGPLLGVRINWSRRRGPTSTAAAVGALRGLESLFRLRGSSSAPAPETIAQLRWLTLEAETPARRLALLALNVAGAADAATIAAALGDDDVEVRRLGAASSGATDELVRRALNDRSPAVRYEALRSWGRRFRPRLGCGPILSRTEDPAAHVALLAIDLLADGCLQGERAADVLASAATPGTDVEGRSGRPIVFASSAWHKPAHALFSLAKADPDKARRLLPAFASAQPWQVRMYAARAAGVLGAADLLAQLSQDPEPNVVESAVAGLAAVSHHSADAAYLRALERDDGQLIMASARALEGTPARTTAALALTAALTRLSAADRDSLRDPRLALLERLEEVGSADQAAALLPLLHDRDAVVADRAARVLAAWTGRPQSAEPAIESSPARQSGDETRPPDDAELSELARSSLRVTVKGGGRFEIRLLADLAPLSCARFARLASAGYYDGLTFHRVVANFIVQGGSPGANEYSGARRYIPDEVGRVMQSRGTVGSSTRGRGTGDGQFYVNLVDNPRLDHEYSIFGQVTSGMDVVDRLLEGDVIERVEVVKGRR
jgi:cyclophilin family peptidyl-prolyl cis-trans isomerase/HEAT repeat protein